MKRRGTPTIRNIARIISEKAILITIARLCILFFKAYIAVSISYYQVHDLHIFNFAYARKRIVNPTTHDHKFALFPCSAGHGPI